MENANKELRDEFADHIFGWGGAERNRILATRLATELIDKAERHFAPAQQSTGDLRETFKNLIQGLLEGYDAAESPYTEPAKEAAESMATQLISEVERHIAQVVVPESLSESQANYANILCDMCQDVINNSGEAKKDEDTLNQAIREMHFAMDDLRNAQKNTQPAKPIIVTVEGGCAEVDCSTIPQGMSVIIRDYDNGERFDPEYEDADECSMEQDSDGKWYSVSEYGYDDRPVTYSNTASRCDNCKHLWEDRDMIRPVPDLEQRVEPGGIVPSGECPNCGSLCYPFKRRG